MNDLERGDINQYGNVDNFETSLNDIDQEDINQDEKVDNLVTSWKEVKQENSNYGEKFVVNCVTSLNELEQDNTNHGEKVDNCVTSLNEVKQDNINKGEKVDHHLKSLIDVEQEDIYQEENVHNLVTSLNVLEPEDINPDERIDNLESFLNDVYENECKIKADQEEINLIQEGIEHLVEKIVDTYLEQFSEIIQKSSDDWNSFLDAKEIYFKLPKKSLLSNDVSVNTADFKSHILKVGSFYEGTKNKFPDEFDFIFPIACLEQWDHHAAIIARHSYLDKYKNSLKYISLGKKIIFDKVARVHGPAYMLIFKYDNGFGTITNIKADLVPAYSFIADYGFQQFVKEYVFPKSFRNEVLKADKYLGVRGQRSVTQSEVHFMRNVLSKKHLKAYRILKYLINGHDDGELLNHYYKVGYSSYEIKTMMIYHHEECKNPDTDKLGECVIRILEKMYKHSKHEDKLPALINISDRSYHNMEFLQILKSMTQALIALHSSKQTYNHGSVKMRSVSGQYLDVNSDFLK